MDRNTQIAIDVARDEKQIAYDLLVETVRQNGKHNAASLYAFADYSRACAELSRLEVTAYASGLWRGAVCETVEGINR